MSVQFLLVALSTDRLAPGAPGPTATDPFLDGKSPELIDRPAKMNPMERLGTPEDIASAVAFLVGPDGGWINGQVLRANGGMV
jgi:3-oxoacyl-[acyl-carrier protein] reductase